MASPITSTPSTAIKMAPIKASTSAQDFAPKRRRFQRRNSKTSFMLQAAFQTQKSHSCNALNDEQQRQPQHSQHPPQSRRRFQRRNSKTSYMLQEALKTSSFNKQAVTGGSSCCNVGDECRSPMKNETWNVTSVSMNNRQSSQSSPTILKTDVASKLLQSIMIRRHGSTSSNIKDFLQSKSKIIRGNVLGGGQQGHQQQQQVPPMKFPSHNMNYNNDPTDATDETESITDQGDEGSSTFLCDDFNEISLQNNRHRCGSSASLSSSSHLPTSSSHSAPLPLPPVVYPPPPATTSGVPVVSTTTVSSTDTTDTTSVVPASSTTSTTTLPLVALTATVSQQQPEQQQEQQQDSYESSVSDDEEMEFMIQDEPSRILPPRRRLSSKRRSDQFHNDYNEDETTMSRRDLLLDDQSEFHSMLERCRHDYQHDSLDEDDCELELDDEDDDDDSLLFEKSNI